MLQRLKLLAGLIYLTTLAPSLTRGATVTAIAEAQNFQENQCSDSQTATGPFTTVTASADCNIGGDHGSAVVSATFLSLTSNSLSVVASSIAPFGSQHADVFASGTASWSQPLVVRGGTGTGVVLFDYLGQGTQTGDPAGITCTVSTPQSSSPQNSCQLDVFAPFTFDVPFNWSTTLFVRTMVPNFESSTLQETSVAWTLSLQSVSVLYTQGGVIPGARVDLVPEPGTLSSGIGAILICFLKALRRAGRTRWPTIRTRRLHLTSSLSRCRASLCSTWPS